MISGGIITHNVSYVNTLKFIKINGFIWLDLKKEKLRKNWKRLAEKRLMIKILLMILKK
jgi:hypothetical protein